MNTESKITVAKSEIINKVKAIANQKDAKKTIVASYNEVIKGLQSELDALLMDLEALQSQVLTEVADDLLDQEAA